MKNFMKLTLGIAMFSFLLASCEKTYDCNCYTSLKTGATVVSDTTLVQAYSMLTKKDAQKNCDGATKQYIDDFNANLVEGDTTSKIECSLK